MEDNEVIEKFIGIYLLLLFAADSIIMWPLSYYIVEDYIQVENSYIGLYIGLILFSHSLGKLLSYRLISIASSTYSSKWILLLLSFGSAITLITIGIFPSYIGVLSSRFISGVCSNAQLICRKFIQRIIFIQKGDWAAQSRKALWAHKIGGIIGVFISCFLISPKDYLPKDSKFVQNRYLLCMLIMFLLEISGILLIFSIDMEGLQPTPIKKYVELPENNGGKEAKEQKEDGNGPVEKTLEEISPEQKEKFDFKKFVQSGSICNEFMHSEESISMNEVKYYSPRQIDNKPELLRKPMSARPKFSDPKSSQSSSREIQDKAQNEFGFKRIHISFIEEDVESIQEAKIDKPKEEDKIQPPVELVQTLQFSLIYRVFLSFFLAYSIEPLPFYFIFDNYTSNPYALGTVLLLSMLFSTIFKLKIMDLLCNKVNYGSLIVYFLVLLIIFMCLIPIISYFRGYLVILGIIGCLIMCCGEILSPAGCVMVSDSVPVALREITIKKNDFYCIISRSVAVFLAPFMLSLLGVSFHFWTIALGLCILAYQSKKINMYFHFMSVAPYKL
ncbi:hypothetical protein SteCoe_21103 [Stentor coeruleus]|uniref:Major facilitator superfamily (MFS) profile domain-containing protein n=1 Tax=Stentor coeruleus TaxID=5963 RepID=A0A1R2BQI0_9CILI|nr:hypothetical protein SteCoe_21103 [Stentor coeruleus]